MKPTRAPLLLALALCACSVNESYHAHLARRFLEGASAPELDACAGTPAHIENFGPDVEYRTYEHDASGSGGISVTVPVFGGLSLSGGGWCRATFELRGGRVTALRYAGDRDLILAPDAICAPLVSACVAEIAEIRKQELAHPETVPPAGSTRYFGP